MNVQEIIQRVRLEIENDLTDTQIIGRINECTRQIFRKLPFPERILTFYTSEVPYYILPDDCVDDGVRCVVVDNIEYVRVNPPSSAKPYYCMVMLDNLYIKPNTPDKVAYLYYRARPVDVKELTDVPNISEDYHTLYVYDAAQWIAGIQRDTDMKNNFYAEFSNILQDAERDMRKKGLKTVKETTKWW